MTEPAARLAALLLSILAASPRAHAVQDRPPDPSGQDDSRPIADFEGDDYGGWTATGDAFGRAPARGTLPGQMHVDGFLGRGLDNSFLGGDAATGTLTSPPFVVERKVINLLVGGGKFPGRTRVDLVVDGRVQLEILADRGSIEVFGNAGRVALSVGVVPPGGEAPVALFAKGGEARFRSIEVSELSSIWTR